MSAVCSCTACTKNEQNHQKKSITKVPKNLESVCEWWLSGRLLPVVSTKKNTKKIQKKIQKKLQKNKKKRKNTKKYENSKILKHFRFGPKVTETKFQPYVQIKTINASTQKIPSLYLEAFLKNALDKITFFKI